MLYPTRAVALVSMTGMASRDFLKQLHPQYFGTRAWLAQEGERSKATSEFSSLSQSLGTKNGRRGWLEKKCGYVSIQWLVPMMTNWHPTKIQFYMRRSPKRNMWQMRGCLLKADFYRGLRCVLSCAFLCCSGFSVTDLLIV